MAELMRSSTQPMALIFELERWLNIQYATVNKLSDGRNGPQTMATLDYYSKSYPKAHGSAFFRAPSSRRIHATI